VALVLAAVSVTLAAGVANASEPTPRSPASAGIIVNFKMNLNARFERAIDNPDIKVVSVAGTLRCATNARRPSNLTIKVGRAAIFTGGGVRGVACKPLDPAKSRAGGSWSGEVVGKCSGKPAVARLLVADDMKGGGDVRIGLKGAGAFCTVAVARKQLVGSLTAFMAQDRSQ
jgi:hypothetical protein